ncbi:hypothetical protein ACKS0A_11425 [Histoplasma ohiense]
MLDLCSIAFQNLFSRLQSTLIQFIIGLLVRLLASFLHFQLQALRLFPDSQHSGPDFLRAAIEGGVEHGAL